MSTLSETVREHARQHLRPLAERIDREGFYPKDYLHELGRLGGFAALLRAEENGQSNALAEQADILRAVAAECGSTGFTAWCQATCAWYLAMSANRAVRKRYFRAVSEGRLLAGTGMSNTVKHLDGLEKHLLKTETSENGYLINGGLPWVSNIGDEHVWACTAQTTDGGYVMFMVEGWRDGISLKPSPEFCALEGTRTLSVRFKNVEITAADVLAAPDEFPAYLARIKPGFLLLQNGLAAGIIDAALAVIRDSCRSGNPANAYLSDSEQTLQNSFQQWQADSVPLYAAAQQGRQAALPVLKSRAAASELALRAAQSAVLHAGAKGYLKNHAAQRIMREAVFVAIVTPALKHLRREIVRLEETAVAI